jgi:hypothetical protein
MTAAAGRPPRRPLDRDRRAAYDAERFAFDGSWLLDTIPPDVAVRLTERVLAAPAWRRLHPEPITVARTRRADSYCTSDRRVGFGTVVEVATIAHELAHAVTHHRHPDAVGHGPEWRGWFVTVVAMLHGDEEASGLAEAFATYGLAVTRAGVEWTGRPLLDAHSLGSSDSRSSSGPGRPNR